MAETESEWQAKRGKWIEEHYTETPHIDKYIITLELDAEFAQENDMVHNAEEAMEWLRFGDLGGIIDTATEIKVLKVRKVD
jgi:hypothetical protein